MKAAEFIVEAILMIVLSPIILLLWIFVALRWLYCRLKDLMVLAGSMVFAFVEEFKNIWRMTR
jgi:hypothetical protein